MGTHPIFESDFDCLTGCISVRFVVVRFTIQGVNAETAQEVN